jgi:hypothetical protein
MDYLRVSWRCPVSIVSDCRLDEGVRSLAAEKDFFFSSLCVQTSSDAHPAPYPVSTSGPFPGIKRGLRVTLTTHPHLVPRSRISRTYICSPPWCLHDSSGIAFGSSQREQIVSQFSFVCGVIYNFCQTRLSSVSSILLQYSTLLR